MKNKYAGIIPRTYILSHCDFTANLTLTISHVINLEQVYTCAFRLYTSFVFKKLEDPQIYTGRLVLLAISFGNSIVYYLHLNCVIGCLA